jgi:2,3-bisphosphoglycerate-independent phosphoglycerate mutase
MNSKNVVLVILDGWGVGPSWGGNAITIAKTQNYNRLLREYSNTIIHASGKDVGLPGHEVGNSEVGHMNIGAGQIVMQDVSVINESIKNGTFYTNPVLTRAIIKSRAENKAIHLMGILSNGGIHSHIDHLFALLKMCKHLGHDRVYIHAFTDGRDTDQLKGIEFANECQKATDALQIGELATVIGRVYLDRKNDWPRTKVIYDALVDGIGEKSKSALIAISEAYRNGETDEFIKPKIIEGTPRITNGDTVIFFNFRADRAKQISLAFVQDPFVNFKRRKLSNLTFISFVPYSTENNLGENVISAFQNTAIDKTLGGYFSSLNLQQFHIAETEKYAHVTYFIDGNREAPYPGEDRMIIPSPNVPTYDLKPEMSASEVNQNLIGHIKRKSHALTICNFANGDMVGHTGNFDAAVKAVEYLDEIIRDFVRACVDCDTPLVVIADHGNIEQMVDPLTNKPYTEHTNNPVPIIIVDGQKKYSIKENGRLSNVAATCIQLSGLEIPNYFDGSLIENSVNP